MKIIAIKKLDLHPALGPLFLITFDNSKQYTTYTEWLYTIFPKWDGRESELIDMIILEDEIKQYFTEI